MTNTTTRAALESRAQKNARRTAEAHRRHAAPQYDTMTATEGEYPTIIPALDDMTAAALYYLPELCAAFVLRARHRETGLQLFNELATAAKRDAAIMHHRAERAERAAESRAEYEEARDTAAELDRIAERISTPEDIAEAAALAAAEEREKRDRARDDADAINKADSTATTSERAALVQAAAARLTEMMTNGDDLTTAIPELCRAASAALAELSNPDSMTRNKTVTRWMDADEATELISRYSIDLTEQPPQKIPAAMTKAGAACYKTIETRDRAAERKHLAKHDPAALERKATTADGQAICIIYHYKTIAPYVTFSQFASPDNAPELADNEGINVIFNQSDRERINDLFDRAKLTDRERLLCLYANSQTADKRAKAAHRASMDADAERIAATDRGHRAQERTRAEARATRAAVNARWTYAFDRLSRTDSGTAYSTQTRDKYRRRICAALAKARTAPEAPTAAERAEAERRKWEAMQRNSRRAAAPAPAERIDLLTAASIAASTTPAPAPVIHWQTRAQANNSRHAAAARLAKLDAESRIDNSTPEARAAAEAAAELYKARRAAEAAEAQRKAAEREADEMRRAAEAARRAYAEKPARITIREFNAQTDAERRAFLASCNYHFDFIK